MKEYLFIFILSIFYFSAFSQSPYLRQYTDRDGLVGMNVYQLLQDDNGLIWIATDNGICYFDGSTFKKMTHPKMKDFDFFGMHKATTGRIWFWNFSGQVFYVDNFQIEHYSPNNFLDDYVIRGLYSDNENRLWMSRNKPKDDLIHCDSNGKCAIIPFLKEKELPQFIEDISKKETGKSTIFWTNKFFHIKDTAFQNIIIRNNQLQIGSMGYNTGLGWFYISETSNILRTVRKKNKKTILKNVLEIPKDHQIRDIYQDQKNNFWVLSDTYLYLFDSTKKSIPIQIPLIKNKAINSLIQDKNGGYWFGTRGEGIIYIANKELITININNSKLPSDNISKIIIDNNKIRVATIMGDIIEFDKQVNITKTVKVPGGDTKIFFKRDNNQGYFINSKNGFFQLDNNYRLQKKYEYGGVKFLSEDKDTLYLGSSLGANFQYQNKFGRYVNRTSPDFIDHFTKIHHSPTYAIQKYKDKIYIGSTHGLFSFTNDTSVQILFSENKWLNKAWIMDIIIQNDTMWLATNRGLLALKNDQLIQSYTEKNGLTSNNCSNILFDEKSRIWIATHQGINIIQPQTQHIQTIGLSNGLPSNRINTLAIDKDIIWVGTPRGLVYFNKNQVLKDKPIFPVIITNVQLNGIDTVLQPQYIFKYLNNSITLEFTSPSFLEQNKLIYHYRLKGLNNDWNTTSSTVIPFSNLPPGQYQFEIYASNDNGIFSTIQNDISIHIIRPIWQKWWFVLLGILLIMTSLIFISFRIARTFRLRRERKINFQRELSESKIQALQSQMNPHFIFNALNAIQHFFTIDAKELAILHLNKFAQLIRLIFEYSKQTTIPLYKEIVFLKLYLELEQLRFREKVNISFQTINITLYEEILIPPLLIQPAIENAFKHGLLHKIEQGSLKIVFQLIESNSIKCTIEDDGIGLKAAKKLGKKWVVQDQKSSGIETIKERIALFNSSNPMTKIKFEMIDLADISNQTGTRVIFTFDILEDYD